MEGGKVEDSCSMCTFHMQPLLPADYEVLLSQAFVNSRDALPISGGYLLPRYTNPTHLLYFVLFPSGCSSTGCGLH